MSNVKLNAQDYINRLYDQNEDKQKQLLMDAYSKGTQAIDTQKQEAQQQTDTNLERTYVEAQRAQQSYKPQNVSDAVGQQAALTLENQQKKNAQAIRGQQQTAEAELERVRKVYADQYAAAIKQAQADNDMERAQQLYEAAKAKDAELSGFYSSVGTLDNEALINKIYESANESGKQELEIGLIGKLSEIYAAKEAQKKQTDEALNQTYVDALKQQKNYAEVQNAYGLGSGNMAQAKLAQNTDLTGDLTELRRMQMAADAGSGMQNVETQKSYADAVADLVKSNEQKRLEALYREAKTREAPTPVRSYENYSNYTGYTGPTEPTETTLSDAGKAFMSNLPYLNAGGSVTTWKNTVKQRLDAANASGNLSDEDKNIITKQLELDTQTPTQTEEYTVKNRNSNDWVTVGNGRMTWGELEAAVEKGTVKEIIDEENKTIQYKNVKAPVAKQDTKSSSSGVKNALK